MKYGRHRTNIELESSYTQELHAGLGGFGQFSPEMCSKKAKTAVLSVNPRRVAAGGPNWFTQEGTHVYRMSIMPHADDWRARYHEAIGFNFPLLSFASPVSGSQAGGLPDFGRFFALQPSNLVLTALKKAENSEQLVARFYEAEGFACEASCASQNPSSGRGGRN